MKKQSIILVCILVAMISCTKSKEVHPEIGDGNDEIVTVGVKDVHLEYARTDHAELNKVIFHYSPADANGNAQQFEAAEMTKRESFFDLILNNLLSDTLYWYYYELFLNGGDAFTTVQKTFHTQACEQPEPPTPPTPPSGVPEGAINGLFTINENGDQVYFSQGNLQYQASTGIWRFAEHQWDFVGTQVPDQWGYAGGTVEGSDNDNISETCNGWIDLFGWGTSGYNHGAICYQPWGISQNTCDYYAYGLWNANLNEQTGLADWGYNAINNGGNQINQWRTLTHEEWLYILNIRTTLSGIRYAIAQVNNVNGIIILPDNWNSSIYYLNNTDDSGAYYNSNVINNSGWAILGGNGCVFLPASGIRLKTEVILADIQGNYWSASCYEDVGAYFVGFDDGGLDPNASDEGRANGQSVRLVQDAH